MICVRAKELYSDYCDGTIDSSISIPFETHIDECASCKAELTDLRSVWLAVNAMPILEAPSEFRSIVWKKIEAQQESKVAQPANSWFRFNFKSILKPSLAFGAFAIALILLAPVVIPGNRTNAGLGFSWFGTKPAAIAGVNIAVGEPTLGSYEGKSWINLPVDNKGTVAVSLDVDVQGTGVEKSAIHVDSPAGTNNMFHLTPLTSTFTSPIIVKTTWEQNGTVNSKVYKLNP